MKEFYFPIPITPLSVCVSLDHFTLSGLASSYVKTR